MSWQLLTTHAWQAPLEFTTRMAAHDFALLYSGRQEASTGRTSYLLLEPAFQASGSQWHDLPPIDESCGHLPDWVGYVGYGMREPLARGEAPPIGLPDFWLTRYQRLFRFDHEAERIEEYGRYNATSPLALSEPATWQPSPAVRDLQSNMDRSRYERIVRDTISAIEQGDFYQANITRKFHGQLTATPDALSLFAALCEASPAPYSALLKHGSTAILSASPELFLRVTADGTISSRPIKGSIRRGTSEAEDAALKKALAASAKNLAENLMIVDLMRHDLSQVSEVGSVQVAEQSGLYSYATIHHLVSTVCAQKLTGCSAYDAVRACFPPGSMTGAPKRAAIAWCEAQERHERGVYSGAIGWFGANNTCDLSVVIRTLLLQGDRFEFQVGGGIVAESTAEDEWRETLVKARGIAKVLGIAETALEAL